TQGERVARRELKTVADVYRPGNLKPALPALTPDAGLSNFLAYALLNSPTVEAAYYNWSASVESITAARSLPDPQLTFQSDIMDIIKTVMPGFMQKFPGPGKLRARAAVATAESRARYFAFESAALQTAFDLKRSYYELHFLDARLKINRETFSLLGDLERIARAQNEVGKGTLQDVLRAQIERDRVRTDIADLEDSRRPMLAEFKAALGLMHDQPDPPVPARLETTAVNPNSDALLRIAFARNPRLKAMEADVRAAEAGIAVAYKERVPNFSLGLMADAKASPTMFRPQAGMTLPIWRDKIAAEIAHAKANEMAARARLSAEQIALTVDFAEKSFAYRQIGRNLDLLEKLLIPKARQSLEIARAGYLAGTIDFFNLMDAERTLLNFELSEVEARTQREIVLADLSLLVAGVPPQGEPLFAGKDSERPASKQISK
ncbi:MAG TPA: TolC family protein, partial [Verrucomicrobiae bacterium]|nr:TolC family protein [Verrucomicrobiae bacterium]